MKERCVVTVLLVVGAAGVLTLPVPTGAATIYVSPQGDDAWSGRLAHANVEATDGPVATLERAWRAAKGEGLDFVYLGNVPGHEAENTSCPGCGEVVIRRVGFRVLDNRIDNGRCPDCRRKIPGVWS